MKDEVSRKEAAAQKLLLGISVAAVVVVVGLVLYFMRTSDPAARGPIPYKKFDYGAHLQEQTRQLNQERQVRPATGAAR